MAPLPILILLGVSVGEGVDRETAQSFFGILELVIALLGILAAALFAYLTRPPDLEQSSAELDRDG